MPTEYLQTPSQTVGPYYSIGLTYERQSLVVDPSHPRAIRLHGVVSDGAGKPIPDAIVETWQADESGRRVTSLGAYPRDGYTFSGFGRSGTTPVGGEWSVTTVKPGATGPSSAPHVLVTVFARGLTHHLFTSLYFDDEPEANAADARLALVPEERRGTLISTSDGEGGYRFDIRVQGEGETVFWDFDGR